MAPPLRRSVLVLAVLAAAVWAAWQGFGYQTMGDFPNEFAPAMHALLGLHLGSFFGQLPLEGAGGSVALSAPAALVAKALGGDQLAVFRAVSLFAILISAGLGWWLGRDTRRLGAPARALVAVLAVCVLAPGLLDTIRFGHPEEAVGAVLSVVAVLLAARDRAGAAGIVLGLAIVNKPWGILAAAPVLLAAPSGRRAIVAWAFGLAMAWNATAYLAAPAHFAQMLNWASSPIVAHPADLWWPLAHLRLAPGLTAVYLPPRWVYQHGRELAAIAALLLSIPLARSRARTPEGCLALLALIFLVRCLLDPSDHIYYHVPFVLALIAWEARTRGWPVLSLAATGGLWLVFHTISGVAGLTVQFVAYLAVALPLVLVLLRPASGRQSPAGQRVAPAPPAIAPGYRLAA